MTVTDVRPCPSGCGTYLYDDDRSCPRCGGPTRPPQRRRIRTRNLLLAGALLTAGVLGVAYSVSLTQAPTTATVAVLADPGVCWSANIGRATQDGCGFRSYPVTDSTGAFSSVVQKRSGGSEKVTIAVLVDGKVVATNSTSAAYGVAVTGVSR